MNWIDTVILILAVIGFIKGCSDGLIRQVVMLIALVAALYLCSTVAVYIRDFLYSSAGNFPEQGITVFSYILAFLLIVGVIVLAGYALHKMLDVTPLSLLNRLAGGVFSLVFTALLISLTLNIIDYSDRDSSLISKDTKEKSRFYEPVKAIIPMVYLNKLFELKNQPSNEEDEYSKET